MATFDIPFGKTLITFFSRFFSSKRSKKSFINTEDLDVSDVSEYHNPLLSLPDLTNLTNRVTQ